MATRFIDHLLEGVHGALPAAGDVPQGTLFSCSDHSTIYQSDGTSTWSDWAVITAGSGDVATDAIWDAKGDLAAATGANAAVRLPVGSANGMQLVVASGETTGLKWRTAEWDNIIVKASNDTVTNSTTLVNDSELAFAIGTDEVWQFDLQVVYDATLNGDYKCDWVTSTGTFSAVYRYLGSDNTANAVLVSSGVRDSGVSSTTDIAAGGTSGGTKRTLWISGHFFAASTTMTITYRMAQNSAQVGESAVTKIGTILKYKKLA